MGKDQGLRGNRSHDDVTNWPVAVKGYGHGGKGMDTGAHARVIGNLKRLHMDACGVV